VYALGVLSGSENHWSPEKALAVIEQTPLTHKGGILQAGPPEAVYQHDPHELRVVLAAKTRKQAPAPIASVVTDWAHRETAGFQGRAQTGFLTAYTEDIRPGEVQSPRPDVSSMLVKDNVTGEWLDPITWRKKQQRLRNFGNEMLPVDTFAEGQ
jgi:hypothetical protein